MRNPATADSCLCRDIGELSIAEIAKQVARTDGCYVDVIAAIVVEVAHRTAHAVHLDVQAGAVGYIGEGAVVVVVIERRRGSAGLVLGPVHGLDE